MKNIFQTSTALFALFATSCSDCFGVSALSLAQAEATALEKNHAHLATSLATKSAQADAKSTRGALLPSLTLATSDNITDTSTSSHTRTVSVSQVLYNPSAQTAYALAKLSASDAILDEELSCLTLLYNVRRNYFLAVLAEAKKNVYAQKVELLQEALDKEASFVDAGTHTRLELDRARVALVNARSEYFRAVQEAVSVAHALGELLGTHEPIIPAQEPPPPQKETLLLDPNAYDLHTHPAYVSASIDYDRAQKIKCGIAQKYLPSISLGASYAINPGSTDITTGTLLASWSLFDGGAREYSYISSQHTLEAAQESLYQTKLTLTVTLATILARFDALFERFEAALEGKNTALEANHTALERHRAGQLTPLDLREVIHASAQAHLDYLSATFDLCDNYCQLLQLTGMPYKHE